VVSAILKWLIVAEKRDGEKWTVGKWPVIDIDGINSNVSIIYCAKYIFSPSFTALSTYSLNVWLDKGGVGGVVKRGREAEVGFQKRWPIISVGAK